MPHESTNAICKSSTVILIRSFFSMNRWCNDVSAMVEQLKTSNERRFLSVDILGS